MKGAARALQIGLALALIGAAGMACGTADSGTPAAPTVDARPLPVISADVRAARGQIVESAPLQSVDPAIAATRADAKRVVYRSVSGLDGTPTEVSGTVFSPPGTPPPGGWPVVTLGHGTTGVTIECGPSLYPDLLGYAGSVAPLVKQGFVVAFSDYQGLGNPGVHPFHEPITSAFNLIDAVRAARNVYPAASTRWAAVGVSQGGQASWSAAELAADYGDGLDFVGSVIVSPAAETSALADLAASGRLSRYQQAGMPFLIAGLTVADPSARRQDYLHGALSEDPQFWLSCVGNLVAERSAKAAQLRPEDTMPSSDEATERFRRWLEEIALPQKGASGPLLVINGDSDDAIPPQWVQSAVNRACALGDTVQHSVRRGQGHDNVDPGAQTAIWLEERFAGLSAPSNC